MAGHLKGGPLKGDPWPPLSGKSPQLIPEMPQLRGYRPQMESSALKPEEKAAALDTLVQTMLRSRRMPPPPPTRTPPWLAALQAKKDHPCKREGPPKKDD